MISEYRDDVVVIDGLTLDKLSATRCLVSLRNCCIHMLDINHSHLDIGENVTVRYLYARNSNPIYDKDIKGEINKLNHMWVDKNSHGCLNALDRYPSLTMIGYRFNKTAKLPVAGHLELINCYGSITGKVSDLELHNCTFNGFNIHAKNIKPSHTTIKNARIFTRDLVSGSKFRLIDFNIVCTRNSLFHHDNTLINGKVVSKNFGTVDDECMDIRNVELVGRQYSFNHGKIIHHNEYIY